MYTSVTLLKLKLSFHSKGMKIFQIGEHRRGKLCAQGLKTTIADQWVEITDDEAGYFGQLQEHQELSVKCICKTCYCNPGMQEAMKVQVPLHKVSVKISSKIRWEVLVNFLQKLQLGKWSGRANKSPREERTCLLDKTLACLAQWHEKWSVCWLYPCTTRTVFFQTA